MYFKKVTKTCLKSFYFLYILQPIVTTEMFNKNNVKTVSSKGYKKVYVL